MQSNKLYFLLPCFLIFVMESQSMDLTAGLKNLQRSLTDLKDILQRSPVSEKGFDPIRQVNITNDILRAAFKAAQEQIKVMVNFSEETKNLIDKFLQYIEENKDVESVAETPDIVTRLYNHIQKSFNKTNLQAFIDAINKLVIAMDEAKDFDDVNSIKVYLGDAIVWFDNFFTIKYQYYFGESKGIERVTNPKFPFLEKKAAIPRNFYRGHIHTKIPVTDPKKYKYDPKARSRVLPPNFNYILRHAFIGKEWVSRAQ